MSRLAVLLIGVVLGVLVDNVLTRTESAHESAQPAERQPDDSLKLARQPGARIPAAPKTPKGSEAVRELSVSVRPAEKNCPICRVNVSLVHQEDGTLRALAKSPTGEVIDGVDVPLVSGIATQPHANAIGISGGTGGLGLWIDHDAGPWRMGADVFAGAGQWGARVRLGVAW